MVKRVVPLLLVAFLAWPLWGQAQNPVTVAFEVTGTPGFGAAVSVKATVTINDGSSLQGLAWSQTGGVQVTLAGANTDTVSFTVPGRAEFRQHLIEVLKEPALTAAQLPPNVPVPEEHFPGGLQDRFQVVAVNPHALADAGAIVLKLTVTTTSGTYSFTKSVAVPLPWKWTTGIRNVPVGLPVLLYAPEQATYDWNLVLKPVGSNASLTDPTAQTTEFIPDVPGTYRVTVTDLAGNKVRTLEIIAGLWRGVITGQDANERPIPDTACTGCHISGTPLGQFAEWKESGHAEIFTNNVKTNDHYGVNCLSCHTVGYDTSVNNGGIDDADKWQDFLNSGLLTHTGPNNWAQILAQFPEVAKRANIQCENCHGPQNSEAHARGGSYRTSLSSDVCAYCHGEPPRHGRFQQWQLSGHANYELAGEEGMSGSCAPCHTGNGFLAWAKNNFQGSSVQVTWTAEEVHPQTCQTCHDPHDVGTTSGGPTTNAKVRVMGETPTLAAGFKVTNAGSGALCMVCHNGRRGLRDDAHYNLADVARAPHQGPQTDILVGRNMYFVEVGTPGYHSMLPDTCVDCHMEKTPPPDIISYNRGGTNHTFYASKTICSNCHTAVTAEAVQSKVATKMEELKAAVEGKLLEAMAAQLSLGKKIDIGGLATINSIGQIKHLELTESHGRQAIQVTLADNTVLDVVTLNSVKVVPPTGSAVEILRVADPAVAKAGWNYFMVELDRSHGVHNPSFVMRALDLSLLALKTLPPGAGSLPSGAQGGGPGNGAGAVSCTTPFVYWVEVAAHAAGEAGSQWRTDLVARNLSSNDASVKFYLYTDENKHEATATVPAASQKVFEDVVALMNIQGKGSLEVCSDRPLFVVSRTYTDTGEGTFGQFLDGHIGDYGLGAGMTAELIGLRQEEGKFRTNLQFTNGGTTPAEIEVTLYNNSGQALTTYTVTVPAGKVVQDLQPFKNRANQPNLGWGFAGVTVKQGSNVRVSGSVVDSRTNDPTTIPPKR
ncbi:MAG: hypothetical protein AB1751_00445 [Acidobacteriota bacterium]